MLQRHLSFSFQATSLNEINPLTKMETGVMLQSDMNAFKEPNRVLQTLVTTLE